LTAEVGESKFRWLLDGESTVTINGKTLRIEDYVAQQEMKEEKESAEAEYKEESGKFRYAARRTGKFRGKKEERGVSWTRRYTEADIKRMEVEEMANGRSDKRTTILQRILENQGRWVGKDAYSIEGMPKSSLSSIMSRLFMYLNEEGMMIRRKEEGRKGYTYLFKATVENPKAEVVPLYEKYLKWEKTQTQARRDAKAAGKKVEKKPETKENTEVEISMRANDEIFESLVKEVAAKLKEEVPKATVKVQVDGVIRILFGIARG